MKIDPETARKRNDLSLCIINDGKTYQLRLAIAQGRIEPLKAQQWVRYTGDMARAHTNQFKEAFSAADILAVAAEMEEYYADHIKELGAVS